MLLIRKFWFRIVVIILVLLSYNLMSFGTVEPADLRKQSISALQAISIIFAVTSALSLALFLNYVRGIRSNYLNQIRLIRDRLWNIHEECSISDDPALIEIMNNNLSNLLMLRYKEWYQINNLKEWSKNIEIPISEIKANIDRNNILFKHLGPLEDELNELTLLYIRSVCSPIHSGVLSNTFSLIAIGMGVIIVGNVFPIGITQDIIISNIAIAVSAYSILILFMILSLILQEAREELVHEVELEDENNKTPNPVIQPDR